ncbi:hypothetical protein APHWI1_0551 [Anaplasma phagocytophilum str. ApWI1]|uniref:Uncharacterized protein n=2 Tax=Anaplasma phagocytophilum TaxID=948 RepID=A0A0F3N411_ANAPH|nr:hypothetical protein APHWEB_0962 [Anaplasma phagocytophilum str. Webster]KJV62828.1 hypothetical protein EPHNCH_1367 [Anaplasma phagocytophilum str. NCH-1]KJV83143.1 hypothetical protein APHHGE2_1350 [Anaplasma phagocytophilum str. HGE2]KJV84912.1 hypothetical protein APHWI1_0551 [Anaplasma phagocytophilum str. ApWI1]KJV87021.1 hypothetical protein APHNYW_1064 [Anaplasma phagocytophilum str. ApNYW]KJV98401.1 hypothetical protein OTSANNIE_1322 [Anaplasma phagocytophilum str. Annie]KKA00464.
MQKSRFFSSFLVEIRHYVGFEQSVMGVFCYRGFAYGDSS